MLSGRSDEFLSVQDVETGVVRRYWFNVSHIPEHRVYVARQYDKDKRSWEIVDRGLWEHIEEDAGFRFGWLLLSETQPEVFLVKKGVDDPEYAGLSVFEYDCCREIEARSYTINEMHPHPALLGNN